MVEQLNADVQTFACEQGSYCFILKKENKRLYFGLRLSPVQ